VPKLPLNLSKAVEAWKEVTEKTGQAAGIVLAGDPGLVGLAQQQFSTGGTLPATWVRPLAEISGLASGSGEVLVVLVPPEAEAETLAALAQSAPKGGAIVAVDEGAAATGRGTQPSPGCTRLSFAVTPAGWRRLFGACAEAAGDHMEALGRRYPVIRSAAAQRVIYRSAGQNGLIGLAFFIPGADMPAMTLNQMKMFLSVASIYGAEVDRERAVELAGIVGAAFGMRALARYLVRSTSGIGWAIKPATGFAATVAIGLGAIRYFEKGAPASTSRVVAFAGSLRS
jgi:uncharacterized protein (DUF697 family)